MVAKLDKIVYKFSLFLSACLAVLSNLLFGNLLAINPGKRNLSPKSDWEPVGWIKKMAIFEIIAILK